MAVGGERFPSAPAEAKALQERLRQRVRLEPLTGDVRRVAGVDAAFLPGRIVAVAVVLRYPDLALLEEGAAVAPLTFPYVPGLLSFREGSAILAAIARLTHSPDLFLFDGQGIAHPRRLGIASHIGVLLDRPAIGVAKSRLVGEADLDALGPGKGSRLSLRDGDEVIGSVVRSRSKVRPLYVSPGHRTTLEDAVTWTLACCTRYRLPEPTRLADKAAARHKRELRKKDED